MKNKLLSFTLAISLFAANTIYAAEIDLLEKPSFESSFDFETGSDETIEDYIEIEEDFSEIENQEAETLLAEDSQNLLLDENFTDNLHFENDIIQDIHTETNLFQEEDLFSDEKADLLFGEDELEVGELEVDTDRLFSDSEMIEKSSTVPYSASYGEQLEPEAKYFYDQMKMSWSGLNAFDENGSIKPLTIYLQNPLKIRMTLDYRNEDGTWEWKTETEDAQKSAEKQIYEYVSSAYVAIMLDCPEIYWQGAGFSMKIGVDVPPMLQPDYDNWSPEASMERDYFLCSYVTITPDLAYSGAGQDYIPYTSALNEACQSIQSEISALEKDTVFGRIQKIIEYILNQENSLDANYNPDTSEVQQDNKNALRPYCTANFFNLNGQNKLTCEGYAKTFKLFCDRFGIPCVVVKGYGTCDNVQGPHAWNMAKIGENWYLFDLMWDKTVDSTNGIFNFLDSNILDKMSGNSAERIYKWVPEGGSKDKFRGEYSQLHLTYTFNIPIAGSKGIHQYEWSKMPTCKDKGEKICTIHSPIFEAPISCDASGLHNYKINIVQATPTKDGARYSKCSDCGEVKAGSRKVTAKVSTSGLKKSVFVYNRHKQIPAKADIVVRDANNKVLSDSYYSISFRNDSSINVGIYYVDITLKGKYYKGKISLAYRINPTEPKILKCAWLRNGNLKVSWAAPKEVSVSGYQIQYSTDKNFSAKKTKTLTVSGGKTLTKQIKGLAKKNDYYIRIRAYKNVNGKRLYSKWTR